MLFECSERAEARNGYLSNTHQQFIFYFLFIFRFSYCFQLNDPKKEKKKILNPLKLKNNRLLNCLILLKLFYSFLLDIRQTF